MKEMRVPGIPFAVTFSDLGYTGHANERIAAWEACKSSHCEGQKVTHIPMTQDCDFNLEGVNYVEGRKPWKPEIAEHL